MKKFLALAVLSQSLGCDSQNPSSSVAAIQRPIPAEETFNLDAYYDRAMQDRDSDGLHLRTRLPNQDELIQLNRMSRKIKKGADSDGLGGSFVDLPFAGEEFLIDKIHCVTASGERQPAPWMVHSIPVSIFSFRDGDEEMLLSRFVDMDKFLMLYQVALKVEADGTAKPEISETMDKRLLDLGFENWKFPRYAYVNLHRENRNSWNLAEGVNSVNRGGRLVRKNGSIEFWQDVVPAGSSSSSGGGSGQCNLSKFNGAFVSSVAVFKAVAADAK